MSTRNGHFLQKNEDEQKNENEQNTENELDDTPKSIESCLRIVPPTYNPYPGLIGILRRLFRRILGIFIELEPDVIGILQGRSGDSSERDVILAARTSIQLRPPPLPPAPPPPDFLDDINPDNPQHFNHPAIHENFEYGHNVVQLAVPDPLPHQHPAPPPPPDLLD